MKAKNTTCCFTGHRYIPSAQYIELAHHLREEIIKLIKMGVLYFGAGGALGFDTIAAQAVLDLKTQYPHIKLILVLPCKTQTLGWSSADKAVYENIKSACDKYVYTSDEYTRDCMYKRNRCLTGTV